MTTLDLDAYLQRIGFVGPRSPDLATLEAVLLAHAQRIAFESLDPYGEVVFKARGEQTERTLTAFETVVAPGEGPPLHTHANEDESLYVVPGEVRFKLGDDLKVGSVGAFVFVPRGKPHMLIHFTPSGMERFFDGFAALKAPGPGAFEAVGAEVGMDVVGPPLAQSNPA